jgi:hypothetical protein
VTTIIEADDPTPIRALTRGLTDTEVGEAMSTEARIAKYHEKTDRPYLPKTETEIRATQVVDFALIIPEPENIERGGCSGEHEPGVICWYTWNVSAWGTKWNAYDAKVGETTVQFDTAWSHPVPVVAALALRFPDVTLRVRYADEDLGYNLGEYTLKGSEVISRTALVEGSDEANDFAAMIKYGKSYADLQAGWEADERLYEIRKKIEDESVSWGEVAELQSLADHISLSDTLLLEWAGVPESHEDGEDVACYECRQAHARA